MPPGAELDMPGAEAPMPPGAELDIPCAEAPIPPGMPENETAPGAEAPITPGMERPPAEASSVALRWGTETPIASARRSTSSLALGKRCSGSRAQACMQSGWDRWGRTRRRASQSRLRTC